MSEYMYLVRDHNPKQNQYLQYYLTTSPIYHINRKLQPESYLLKSQFSISELIKIVLKS